MTSTSSLMFSLMYFASVPGLYILSLEETKVSGAPLNPDHWNLRFLASVNTLTLFLVRQDRFRPFQSGRPAAVFSAEAIAARMRWQRYHAVL